MVIRHQRPLSKRNLHLGGLHSGRRVMDAQNTHTHTHMPLLQTKGISIHHCQGHTWEQHCVQEIMAQTPILHGCLQDKLNVDGGGAMKVNGLWFESPSDSGRIRWHSAGSNQPARRLIYQWLIPGVPVSALRASNKTWCYATMCGGGDRVLNWPKSLPKNK